MKPFLCSNIHCINRVIGSQTDSELYLGNAVFRRRHIVFTHSRDAGGCGTQNHWQPIESKPTVEAVHPNKAEGEVGNFG